MHVRARALTLTEDRLVAILTAVVIAGIAASVAFGGLAEVLVGATYYITNSGAAAGGAGAGTGAVAGAAISSSSLSGAALAGAALGGAGLVVAAAA